MRHLLLGAAASAFVLPALALPAMALAGEPGVDPSASDPVTVREVVVTASRSEQDPIEAPATISVTTQREIEDGLFADIKDLVRYEPGVSVRSSPARFGAAAGSSGRDGNAGFNIRGLEGNRVLIQVDGVRLPDAFLFGPQAVGRGDYVDLGLLKSVEILRGPASALYGSDGVAGAVSFITQDPADLLRGDQAIGARARVGYASADESTSTGLTLAGRTGAWSAMLAWTGRDGSEQETQGTDESPDARRTAANPQEISGDSWLGKLVFQPNAAHRFRLTADLQDREVVTEVLSGRAAPVAAPAVLPTTAVIDLDARDTTERTRYALDHLWRPASGPVEETHLTVYHQDAEVVQFAAEDRNGAADRTRLNTFHSEVVGFSGQARLAFDALGVRHRITLGADASETTQEGIRDGTVPPFGETFPGRPFPLTDYRLAGVFIQDEIRLLDGRLTLYPSLRYDAFEVEPKADALYVGATESTSDSRITPRIGAVFWATPVLGLFANYGEGFRAPAPSEVNNGFSNPSSGYISVSNPNLEPETSKTWEAGVRLRDLQLGGARVRGSATVFSGEYENFIEQVTLTRPFPTACGTFALCFQYVNLAEVEIRGFEGRIDADWDSGLGFTAAVSSAEGVQQRNGVSLPLDSVDPLKLVAGVRYTAPSGRFGGQLSATHSAQKDARDVGGACSPGGTRAACWRPDAFTVLDATAWIDLTEQATLRVGAFNLTDETYAWWSDVRGLAASSTVLDAWTQPGRNFSASLVFRY